jgi:beta-fructofuranosidase
MFSVFGETMNRRELLKSAAGFAAAAAFQPIVTAESTYASETSSALQSKLARDPRRPQFHLLPAANWMNDPNGPIYWRKRYHMFFQYNPNGAYWGDMHWAHAVSPDLVHWKHLPIALSPTPGGPDAAGCFTGTIVSNKGIATALYTGVVDASLQNATINDGEHLFRESQCLATSTDPELKSWTKLPHPVISAPPTGMKVAGFRDPCPWRGGEGWYMAVGSGERGRGGEVLLYRSKDLRHWDYVHFLASGTGSGKNAGNPVASGDMWECPDFFPLDGKHMLIYGSLGGVHWQSGVLDEKEMRFHAERSGILDHGSFYAAKTQLDANGNRIVWGWIPEARPLAEQKAAGWAGMMSLPRVLTLNRDGQLRVAISPAVQRLRRHERKLMPGGDPDSQLARFEISNATGEILGRIRPGDGPFTFALTGKLPQGAMSEPLVKLQFDPKTPDQILADGRQMPIHPQQSIEIHIYVDGSAAELVVQHSAAYTKRFYYAGSVAPRVQLQVEGPTTIESLTMWQIDPISSDRLTT